MYVRIQISRINDRFKKYYLNSHILLLFNYMYCYSFIIPPLVLWPCCIYKLEEVFIIEPLAQFFSTLITECTLFRLCHSSRNSHTKICQGFNIAYRLYLLWHLEASSFVHTLTVSYVGVSRSSMPTLLWALLDTCNSCAFVYASMRGTRLAFTASPWSLTRSHGCQSVTTQRINRLAAADTCRCSTTPAMFCRLFL